MAIVSVATNRRTALVAGLFLIAGGLLLVGLVALQLGRLTARHSYFADFLYVGGLQTGAEVRVAGFPIGTVDAIAPVISYPAPSFRVTLSIDPAWRIPVGTKAVIASPSLIGAAVVDLRLAAAAASVPVGSAIETDRDTPIGEQAENVLARVDRFFDQDLQGPVRNLELMLANLDRRVADLFTQRLDPATARLDRAMVSLDRVITGDLVGLIGSLRQSADSLGTTTGDTIPALLGQVETAVADASRLMASVTASVGRIDGFLATVTGAATTEAITGALADARAALDQVRRATATANRLLAEMAPNLATAATDAQFSMQVLSQSLATVLQDLDRAAGDLAGLASDLRRNPAIIFGR